MRSSPLYRLQQTLAKSIPILILILYALLAIFPIFMVLINSFKAKNAIFGAPFELPNAETFSLIGYQTVMDRATFPAYFLNSSIVTFTALVLTLLIAGRKELSAAWHWFASGFRQTRGLLLRLGILGIGLGMLAGAGLFLGQKDYISRLFNTRADSIEEFVIANSAGARAAYMFGALGAYEESPVAGVGLGASGFYMYNHMPDWAMTTVPDIARQFSPENRL